MKKFYTAVFSKEEDGYSVRVPGIAGCNTQGETLEEAYEMAFDAIGLCVEEELENNANLPYAIPPEAVETGENEFTVLVEFDTEKYERMHGKRAVKKTLTIPAWLNTKSEMAGVNFSAVLQNALMRELHLVE